MTSESWRKVFQSFRNEDHKLLVVGITTGLEVAVQELAFVEEEMVMIRGRIAGTADSGRAFLLPYAQIASIYVNRPVRTEELELFLPSATPARKLEVSKQVAELEAKLRQEAKQIEASKGGGSPLDDAFKRIEALREETNPAPTHAVEDHANQAAAAPKGPAARAVPTRQVPGGPKP
jgi:hypothetical protein